MYPCLWFDGQAKAAADHYCSIFKDSKITSENSIVVTFELKGNKFMALKRWTEIQVHTCDIFCIRVRNSGRD